MDLPHNHRTRALSYTTCPTLAWLILLAIGGASAFGGLQVENETSTHNDATGGRNRAALGPAPLNATQSADVPTIGIAGVGFGVACRSWDNFYLSETTDFDKLASAVASTIMTLIPALLTFAPLPTARIRYLHFFSTEAAGFTAAMTLGLYSRSISTLAKSRMVKAKDLCTGAMVALYGQGYTSKSQPVHGHSPAGGQLLGTAGNNSTLLVNPVNSSVSIPALHQLYEGSPNLEDSRSFGSLKARVLNHERPRRIVIAFVIIGFTIVQVSLFGVLVRALPLIDDIMFIWECAALGVADFTWWLGGAAILSAIIRMWTISSFVTTDQVFHLSPLSPSLPADCEDCSVAVRPPPENTPRERRAYFFFRIFEDIIGLVKAFIRLLKSKRRFRGGISWAIQCSKLVSKGFILPHPMIVVLRLSREPVSVTNPMKFMLLGWFQAITLIMLTFLFGSIWAGTLFFTLGFVVAFMTTVVASRTCSIWLCGWMEKALGMTIIECEGETELRAITRILVAMPGVLVESKTDGYAYSAGYRLDTKCPAHSIPTAGGVDGEMRPRTLGFLIGYILGSIVGIVVAIPVYIAAIPAHQSFVPELTVGNLKDRAQPLVMACVIGFSFGVLFFMKTRSAFGVLDDRHIKGTTV